MIHDYKIFGKCLIEKREDNTKIFNGKYIYFSRTVYFIYEKFFLQFLKSRGVFKSKFNYARVRKYVKSKKAINILYSQHNKRCK